MMGTMCHSSVSLFLAAFVLYCAASGVIAQKKSTARRGGKSSEELESSACNQRTCPCRCDLAENVLDCSNETQLASSSREEILKVSCGSLTDFATFNFSYNNFQTFDNFEIFGGGLGRCSLDLSHNELTQVENLVLYICDSISVDFSYNHLTNLPSIGLQGRTSYDLPVYLRLKLNFSHNQITSLRDFIDMDATLPRFYGVLFGSSNRRYPEIILFVDLSFNLIVTLSLSNNLFFIPTDPMTLRNVTILLHNNRISSLESYPYNRGLDNVNKTNILLDLRQNRLSSLPPTTDTTDADSLNLRLEGNQWNCDCHQRWITDTPSKLRQILSNQESTQPFCQHPDHVKDRPLLSLNSVEFVCPPEVDQTVALVYTPSLGDTVELACPLVGGDPQINTLEWKIWLTTGLFKSFLSVKNCANCSFIVNDIDINWEGIYQCTAFNGIKVSSNISVNVYEQLTTTTIDPAKKLSDRGRRLTWPITILLLLLVIVSFGFIVVSYNLCRVKLRAISSGIDCGADESNIGGSNLTPSLRMMFESTSGGSVELSRGHEYQEPTNKKTPNADVEFLYENESRESSNARSGRMEKNTDGDAPNTGTMRQQKIGLNSSYYNIKRPTDRKEAVNSGSQDDDFYETTGNEEYSQF